MSAVETLDPRLRSIASLVRSGSRLADIGCDHGYLICALMRDGKIDRGIACDINEKPLNKARGEIERQGLKEQIACRLGDGLFPLAQDEVDDVVIAGMGGEMIASILDRCPWESLANKQFLLQPMTKAPFLRHWLCTNGYCISAEKASVSGDHAYTVMRVSYTGWRCKISEYDLYCYAGELACDLSEEARSYLWRTVSSLKRQENGVEPTNPEKATKLRCLINKLITVIEEGK
ncbi:MAG TPA: class I SAM-dependent methyltransferase [Clostridia bacterium]|nr:class I SAM-dependent methyltransferase [Clostridia bacterium]